MLRRVLSMKKLAAFGMASLLMFSIAALLIDLFAPHFTNQSPSPQVALARPQNYLGEQPLRFLENRGQAAEEFRFHAEAAGHTVLFAPDRVLLRQSVGDEARTTVQVSLRFLGANGDARLAGVDPLPGETHFYRGKDPSRWRTDVPSFAAVEYRGLYPGIDMRYFSAGSTLKSEFHLAPGADPAAIRLRYDGIEELRIDDFGNLVFTTALGEITEARPQIYQLVDGRQVPVSGGYRLLDDRTVGFELGEYDPHVPLVIDPEFSYLSYLGGSQIDSITDIGMTSDGDLIVVGVTNSNDFPTVSPVQAEKAGSFLDYFITRIDTATGTLVYSTYLGGKGQEGSVRLLVDAQDNVFIAGFTISTDFPVLNALQDTSGGLNDITLTKLDSSGALVFSTYFGGNSMDEAMAMDFDAEGNIWLTGRTISPNFPVTADALQDTLAGDRDAFVAKFSPDGTSLLYSTYLGGSSTDRGNDLLDDGNGRLFIAGDTRSEDFAGTPVQQNAAFVAKLMLGGAGLSLDTVVVVDGSESDLVSSVALAGHHLFFAGGAGAGLPTTSGAVQSQYGGSGDGMVGALNVETMALDYLSYSGTSANDFINDLLVFGPVAAGGGASPSDGRNASGEQFANSPFGLGYRLYHADNVSDVEETGLLRGYWLGMDNMGSLFADPNTMGTLFSLPRSHISRARAFSDDNAAGGYKIAFCGGTYDLGLPVTPRAVQPTLVGSDAGFLGAIDLDIKIGMPQLQIDKQVLDDDGIVEVGERVKYHILVSNVGDGPAENVIVEDAINPLMLSLIPGSITAPCRAEGVFLGYVIRCEYPVLAPGESRSISYEGIVSRTTLSGSPFVNHATVKFGTGGGQQEEEDAASLDVDPALSEWRVSVWAPVGFNKLKAQSTFDIYVDSVRVADDLGESQPAALTAALHRTTPRIDLVRGGDPDNQNPIASFEADLVAGDSTNMHFSDATMFIFSPVSQDSFALVMKADDRKQAADSNRVDLLLGHITPQAGDLDFRIAGGGLDTTVAGLAFGEFSDYLSGKPGAYDVTVSQSTDGTVLAAFRFDFSASQGQVITLLVAPLGSGGNSVNIAAFDTTGASVPGVEITAVTEDPAGPSQFTLQQNFPNPFNPVTTIRYTLAEPGHVKLEIYSISGRKVRTLVDGRQAAGDHAVQWDGRDDRGRQLASGVYLYKIKEGRFTAAHRMLMLK